MHNNIADNRVMNICSKPAILQVNGIYYEKVNGEDQVKKTTEDNRIIEIQNFQTDKVAYVEAAAGATINMGNYNGIRLDVSLKLPCYVEQIEEAYKFASKFVNEKIIEERNKLVKK